eukprot:5582623-Amphidinium_carterae.1
MVFLTYDIDIELATCDCSRLELLEPNTCEYSKAQQIHEVVNWCHVGLHNDTDDDQHHEDDSDADDADDDDADHDGAGDDVG